VGLCITRAVGTGWFGGVDLDTRRPEDTYTHKVWITRIRDGQNKRSVALQIDSDNGDREARELGLDEEFSLDQCSIALIGIGFNKQGIEKIEARLKLTAPLDYKIIRNNARERR